ncbi:MAG: Crp/Fnr family transcriptional regulator [Flavisolibacter sp.]
MPEIACDLTSCFVCTHCIPEWKEVIALKKKTLVFKKGKDIFKEGEKVKGIYFLYTGAVKVYQQWGEQKQLILRFARSGDILGHRGIGGTAIYPITATALEDTRTCFISNEFLEATLRVNPSFTYKLMHFYATELQKAEKRMRDLAHMEVKGRIAGALLELSEIFGMDEQRNISLAVTRQDIASYAGTTYETVFKFLTELIKEKVISTTGKTIRIGHPEKLKAFISGT